MTITKKLLLIGMAFALTACGLQPAIPVGPTATPSPTLTPSVTPTATITPTPTPSPTPVPVVRVASGDHAYFNGDYTAARLEYLAVLQQSSDADLRAAALWGVSRIEYAEGDYAGALVQLRELTSNYPDTRDAAFGFFLMGETYYELDRFSEAAEAYGMYLEKRPGHIDAYAWEARADALYNAGNYYAAIDAYNASLQADRLSDTTSLEIKIANAYVDAGDAATALERYDTLFAQNINDYLKAQLDYQAGNALMRLGRVDEAYQRYKHAVDNYPLSYYSYLALIEVLDAGFAVDDFNRGIIDYFAGQYSAGLAAFDRYLANTPDPDGTARHYRALSLRALGNNEEAAAEWGRLIEGHSDNRYWLDAWNEKAFTEWAYLNRPDLAAKTLLDFVAIVPTNTEAADMLYSAGRMYERADRLTDAITIWQRVTDEYPGSSYAMEAQFQAGIAYYRLENPDSALTYFQRSLLLAVEPADQARAQMWIGKLKAELGDKAAANTAWQQAAALDPTGYYSERARDLLYGRDIFAPPAFYNLAHNIEAERTEAAAWVRLTFGLPQDTDLSSPGPLLDDLRLWRGSEYWELGLKDQARAEFESLREAVKDDPANTFRLTGYLYDIGLYRSAIFAARQVLTLAGLDDAATLSAPLYFNHIRFGSYYSDLITPNAELYRMHPLFLFSVVRQESLFEWFIQSTAGARGLMQIIPTTGTSVAENLGWPDFSPDDLYRPTVNIRFGVHYLNTVKVYTDGNLFVTLAGYNAGPGNADIWNEMARGDPDLFVEIVRYSETRTYIRNIYEIFNIYRDLYNPLD